LIAFVWLLPFAALGSAQDAPEAPPPFPGLSPGRSSPRELPSEPPRSAPTRDERSRLADPANSPRSLSPYDGRPIVDIQVSGNRRYDAALILSQIRSKPGREYNQITVQDDARKLSSLPWFYNVQPTVKEVDDGVIITIRVAEHAVIQSVDYEGARAFSRRKLADTSKVRQGQPMSPSINRQAARDLETLYRGGGYPYATVELAEGGAVTDERVVFKVTEGPRARIASVKFDGNRFVGQARLRTTIKTKGSLANSVPISMFGLGEFAEEQLDDDVAALRDYYRSNGFLDVRVGRKVDWDEKHEWATVTFAIEEGPRYRIGDVKFEGPKTEIAEEIRADLRLVSGQVFDSRAMEHDRARVRDAYGARGYVAAQVIDEKVYGDQEGVVNVVYRVNEDVPKRINDIRVEGNSITKERVVRQYIQLSPGDLADTTRIRTSERFLAQSRLFRVDQAEGIVPTIRLDPTGDPLSEYQDLIVNVQEGQTGSIIAGVGVNSNAGVSGQFVINERNFDLFGWPRSFNDIRNGYAFRGAGQEFRLEAMPGNQVSRYMVSVREPMLFGRQISLQGQGYYFQRFFQNFHEERLGGRFTLGKRFTNRLGGAVSYRIESIDIGHPPPVVPNDLQVALGNNFLHSLRVGIDHDGRDSAFDPSEGHYFEAGYEHAFGDFNFPIFTVEGRKYFKLFSRGDDSGKHVLVLQSSASFAGEDTPIFERFYAGGFNSIRGFQWRGVSPVDQGIEVGGKFQFLASAEYRLPISPDDNFGMVFFCDTGTVEPSVRFEDYRVALGFGFRVKMPQQFGPVPMAFDFGFPVAKGPFDDRQLFSFFIAINQ
jgi:outer membrane protein insertion porin family